MHLPHVASALGRVVTSPTGERPPKGFDIGKHSLAPDGDAGSFLSLLMPGKPFNICSWGKPPRPQCFTTATVSPRRRQAQTPVPSPSAVALCTARFLCEYSYKKAAFGNQQDRAASQVGEPAQRTGLGMRESGVWGKVPPGIDYGFHR